MNARSMFFLALLVLTLSRLWVVLAGEVQPANAYFFLCGENPDLAYFDGPPGTALTVRAAATAGAGWWLALGPLWAAAASLACWRLGCRLAGGEPQAALGAISLNLLPAFNEAAFLAGPWLPALALSLSGLSIAWDAARRQHGGLTGWIIAAASFAAAALFAYPAAAVGLGAAAFVFVPKFERRGIHRFGALLIVAFTAAALLAPLSWNAARDWIPIAGWTPRALMQLSAQDLGSGITGFLIAISPVFALMLPWSFLGCVKSAGDKAGAAYAVLGSVASLGMAAASIYRGWPAGASFLLAAALLLPFACRSLLARPVILSTAFAIAAVFALPVWTGAIRSPASYRNIAAHVLDLDERLSQDLQSNLFFIASTPGLAAVLNYHLRNAIIPPEGHPRVYKLESQDRSSQFAFWPSYDDFIETGRPKDEYFTEMTAENPFLGHSAVYVGPEKPEDLPQAVRAAFADVRAVREIDGLYIYLCLDYQTLPL